MSLAAFVAAQRTDHGVPHAIACRAVGMSESWFYKWRHGEPSPRRRRRTELDAAVREFFDASGGTYGSPRVLEDLRDAGWKVSKKTVEASMGRQGLAGRPKRRRHSLTRPDKRAVPFADLVGRDYSAARPDEKWCGDLTEVPTDEGKLYLATVEDLCSRRLPGFAIGDHHDAELAQAAINMAVAVRGGDVRGVIFHTDRGWRVHGGRLPGGVPAPRHHSVDGPGRVGPRQCGGGELQLHAGARAAVASSLRDEGGGSP